ncbi:MAG: dihydropteroate synthase [Chloroflexi bacterium]|nr:dihydropteroate synthase [Chloroflexota bacterium]
MDYKAEANSLGVTRCRDSIFAWGKRTYIMGVINLSPDSFSGDGCRSIDEALQQAVRFAGEGADIIDVGGESTRPDAAPVPLEEELKRVIPFIKELVRSVSIPVSIDTYKYEVAVQALDAGVGMVNDISGLKMQPSMLRLVAERQAPVVLTSNERGQPSRDITKTVISSLQALIRLALDAGVSRQNLVIDPGIGFGKTQDQNLEILRKLADLKTLGRPILIGTSRKSFIRNVLGTDAEALLLGTAATVAIGIGNGADMVRVHDVAAMSLVCRMCDAVIRGRDER